MQAIRVIQTVESDTLYLPQLRPLMGQRVEIIVLSSGPLDSDSIEPDSSTGSLVGSDLRYDEPFEPATPAEELEACR